MIPGYLFQNNRFLDVRNVMLDYNPDAWYKDLSPAEWQSGGGRISNAVIDELKTKTEGFRLLMSVTTRTPDLTGCGSVLGLEDEEYVYLWQYTRAYAGPGTTTGFCRVLLPTGEVSYEAISRIKHLYNTAQFSDVLEYIAVSFRIAQTSLDSKAMLDHCGQSLTYKDMSQEPLANICGCYVFPSEGYTKFEIDALQQSPQCLPPCLSSEVGYVLGGVVVPCQQNVCVIDNIRVTGTDVKVTQACPQCSGHLQCVCYIHVNETIISQNACNKIVNVGQDGKVTSTKTNQDESVLSGLGKGWDAMWRNPKVLVWLIVAAVSIAVIVGLIFLSTSWWKHYRSSRAISIQGRQAGQDAVLAELS